VTQAIRDAQSDGHWTARGRIYLIGNGGSAAIASHICTDLLKRGHSAFTLTDPAVLTCFSNDYSYAEAYEAQLERHWTQSGTLVAISSSGKSDNIVNAAHYAKKARMTVVTLSGFKPDNPLRSIGDVNYWVPSDNYGVVEIAHLTILHSLVNPG
jgi:D-sedoheptulose 7-phosphate isomerase